MVEAVPGPGVVLRGYLARSSARPERAAAILCPDRDGATAFFEGVARALAKAGIATLLADPLARKGGTAAVPENERAALLAASGAAAERLADLRSAAVALLDVTGLPVERLGIVGFGVGGADAWAAAQSALEPRFRAVVLLAAPPLLLAGDPPAAPVLALYGAGDARARGDVSALERRLRPRSTRSRHRVQLYEGAPRDFWVDHPAAAPAWRDVLAWLAQHLTRQRRALLRPGVEAPPARGTRRRGTAKVAN
jgi:dienelactone hydrolase